jgi:hypothetical protein
MITVITKDGVEKKAGDKCWWVVLRLSDFKMTPERRMVTVNEELDGGKNCTLFHSKSKCKEYCNTHNNLITS